MRACFALILIFSPCAILEGNEVEGEDSDEIFMESINEKFEGQSELQNEILTYFYGEEDVEIGANKENSAELNGLIDIYIQRYLSLFLKTSQLLDYKINNDDDLIKVNLEINLTRDELEFMQNYSKSANLSDPKKIFYKLENILLRMRKVKEISVMDKALSALHSLFSFCYESEFSTNLMTNPYVLSFSFTILFGCLILPHRLSSLQMVFLGVNNMILYESFKTYQRKIMEAEAEIVRKSLLIDKSPDHCDPTNRNWYQNVVAYFMNDCQNYREVLMRDPSDEISFLQSLFDTYAFYLIRKPIELLGSSARGLAKELTSDMNAFVKFCSEPFFLCFVLVFLALFALTLSGLHLNLSFFGASVELGKVHRPRIETRLKVEDKTSERAIES